jgi:hypothetical protein
MLAANLRKWNGGPVPKSNPPSITVIATGLLGIMSMAHASYRHFILEVPWNFSQALTWSIQFSTVMHPKAICQK